MTWERRWNKAKLSRKDFRSGNSAVMTIRHGGAILLAVSCGIAAINSTAPVGTTPAPKPETVRVVVAATDIPRGKIISQEDAKLIEWPRGLAPKSAVPRPEDVVGRIVVARMLAGEPILGPNLANGDALYCCNGIPPGMRAFTTRAARVASDEEGFLRPAEKVNVFVSFHDCQNDETGGNRTTTLLKAVRVLAVESSRSGCVADNNGGDQRLSSITLLVTPDQVMMLDLGEKVGSLTLSRRELVPTPDEAMPRINGHPIAMGPSLPGEE